MASIRYKGFEIMIYPHIRVNFPMDGVHIEFPGYTTRFNKEILKKLIIQIQKRVSGVSVIWYKCKPPFTINNLPKDYQPVDESQANMVVLIKAGRKIFESFKYKSGGGGIIVYRGNLSKKDLSIISNILKDNNFDSPAIAKSFMKTGRKALLLSSIFFMALMFEGLIFIEYGISSKESLVFSLLLLLIGLVLGVFVFYYIIKAFKIKKGKIPPDET